VHSVPRDPRPYSARLEFSSALWQVHPRCSAMHLSCSSFRKPSSLAARHHHRFLLWPAPTWEAASVPSLQEYPLSTNAPMISRRPLVLILGEFSKKMIDGLIMSIARNNCQTRPDRGPLIPAPVPAHEISWQGNPAAMQSIRPCHGPGSNNLMSAHSTCRLGNHPDSVMTRHLLSLISNAKTDSCPRISDAKIPPPPPAKKCPTVIICC